ncbi:MAG: hypothetical protein AAB224_02975 [Gemmatimonadota bacterium]
MDAFSCGTRPGAADVDKYLRERAHTEQAARIAAVWVVEDTAATTREGRIVGFFTLSPVGVRLSPVIMAAMEVMVPYHTMGGWLLGRMGLAVQHQGHDHGRHLVASAIRTARDLSHATAGPVLAVDPANEVLMQWYLGLGFGFQRLAPNDPRILRLALKL